MEIVTPTSDFDLKSITLDDPQPLAGHAGFYFTQLNVSNDSASENNENNKKALCLQLPECITKQGIINVKNSSYMDLMFERDTNEELMHWIETLEYACQDVIDSKKELWFQTDLTRDDIETMMTQVVRLYQSGKYMLMRVFIDINKSGQTQKCIAYDENQIGFDLENLDATKKIIPLVMIEGVKFSSRSFEISLKVVQVMVLGKTDLKTTCLIKRPIEVKDTLEKTQPQIKPSPIPQPIQVKQIQVNPVQVKQRQPQNQAQVNQVQVTQQPQNQRQVTQQPQNQRQVTQQPQNQAQVTQQPQNQAQVNQAQVTQQPQNQAQVNRAQVNRAQVNQAQVNQPVPAQIKPTIPVQVKPVPLTVVKPSPVPVLHKPLVTINNGLTNDKSPINQRDNGTSLGKNISMKIDFNNPVLTTSKSGGAGIINNLEKNENDMEEITINYEDVSDSIHLKNPNEVYYEMYKNARNKAKECRINAIEAYLEAKQIKTKYMLEDLDDDSEDSDMYGHSEDENELEENEENEEID